MRNSKKTPRGYKQIEPMLVEMLGLETLDARNSDRLDFSDQSVETLRAALQAAYAAGVAEGKK